MRIQNSTSYTFSPASQNAIQNAMASAGVEEVVTHTNRPNDEVDNIFNFSELEAILGDTVTPSPPPPSRLAGMAGQA